MSPPYSEQLALAPSKCATALSPRHTEAPDPSPNPTSTTADSSNTTDTTLAAWPHAINATACRDNVVHDIQPSRRFFT
ncbi:hypothetical protein HPB50_019701 [Hyalomma asiaticum]|uniref:Uncharacterized protein n=1 Tax=Hyalomma asiaticum TaxID=266040 RepID=A0ACB7S7G4_HYAAI|nr:hypothetical protein HPB50_019701 [Hyalomma asiaticum]